MKKNLRTGAAIAIMAALLVFAGTGAFALNVASTPPQTGDSAVNTALSNAWTTAISEINGQVGDIDTKPENFIKAFGTASVYASHGATQRGYGEPNLFTFTIGPMVGIKIGTGLDDLGSYIDDIADELENNGDATLGLNAQGISGQFNLNTSAFLLDGLDLGIRLGYFKLPGDILNGIGFDTFSVGVVGNYQILKEKTIVPILLKWRGVSLGTGVILQNTNISYAMELDSIEENLGSVVVGGVSVDGGSIKIDPKLIFDMKTSTVTIPLEASTAVQLFSFLNITLGLGVDLGFGTNDVTLGLDAAVNLVGLPSPVAQTTPGNLSVTAGGEMAPEFFNFKIMTGIGFKLGPVLLDVPLTLYPGSETGASLGVTLGLTL